MEADFWLIQKMKSGDEQAFDSFVRKHYEAILKYCNYHCQDASYAEDLTQEVFLHFFRKLTDYRAMGKTRNYLYTIAGNLCKDHYKKKRDSLLEEGAAEREMVQKDSEAEEIINRLTVEHALRQLPEELREVLILYYFQGLKLTEIAAALQIGLPLTKYRMKQAKLQLGKYLQEE